MIVNKQQPTHKNVVFWTGTEKAFFVCRERIFTQLINYNKYYISSLHLCKIPWNHPPSCVPLWKYSTYSCLLKGTARSRSVEGRPASHTFRAGCSFLGSLGWQNWIAVLILSVTDFSPLLLYNCFYLSLVKKLKNLILKLILCRALTTECHQCVVYSI